LVFSLFCFRRVSLCQPRSKQFIFQIYEDNDFMNIYGRGSDHWYTNGTRLNIFYNRSKKPRSLFYQLSPKAGPGSISTYGWAIMQAMITPSSLNKTFLQRNDYPYAGASFVLHSLHFSDPYRRMNLQTDWVIGVMGPPSLAGQAQTLVHNIGGFASPQGWKYQLPTDLLLNYNLGIEKALTGTRTVGFIAKANLFAGSMMDGISLSSQLRMGRF